MINNKKAIMKTCENCGSDHSGEYGSGRFCSLKCARGFSTKANREEINTKISISLSTSEKAKFANRKTANSQTRIDKFRETLKRNIKDNLLNASFESLNYSKKKQRVFHEQGGKCNKCLNSEWLGQPIPLELEHKDGNNKNNERENLEMLCPNCHALTDTWRGRNKKGDRKFGEKKVSDEALIESLKKNNGIIYRALVEVGLTPKGANYMRCKKIKEKYTLL